MNVSLRFAVIGLVGLALAGCPQVPNPDPLPASPVVSEFKASATQVAEGSTVTLSWKVENATSVRIDDLSLGSVSGVSNNEGTVQVSVSRDSTYVLSARNDRGASDSAIVSIRVSGSARDPMLLAVPQSITAGQSSTIAWTAPGATSVTLTSPAGAVDLGGQTASGSVTVTPAVTTEYTLTAGGIARRVTVSVAPRISTLTASLVTNDAGQTIHVAWATEGATRVQLNGAGRGQLADISDATQAANGSFNEALPTNVDPGQYFTYELVATGASGSASRTVVFGIPGNPAITSFTAPERVRASTDGGTVTLTWATLQTSSLSLAAGGAEIYRAPASAIASGTLSVPVPADDTEFVLTARGERGGEDIKRVTVDVVQPPTVTLTANPTTVTAGMPVTLSWAGSNIRNVGIREVGYGGVYATSGVVDTGTATVAPARDVTYVIDVDNGVGDTATAMVTVTVTGAITLTASETGALRQGQNISLSWTVPGGTANAIGLPHSTVDVRAASTGFDDIATTGTSLTFPATAALPAQIVSPFRMPFFGRVVGANISVSHHGFLGFGPNLNASNSLPEVFPSPYCEEFVVAPFWFAMATSTVRWQIKPAGESQVLIVQWNATSVAVQAKLYTSGQIDFEYSALPTTGTSSVGITGHVSGQTTVPPGAAAVGTGFTFFGPKPSPVNVAVWEAGDVFGNLALPSGSLLRVSAHVDQVVRPGELVVNEVLANSSRGTPGQWAELRNATTTALPLAGWSFALPDGGTIPLSGTVPARGLLVVGNTTDNALNGNANVQLAVPEFDLTGITNLTLQRGGPAAILALTTTAGVAQQNSAGPFLGTTGTAGNRTCAATASFGTPSQLGTPGTDTNCGFPYDLTSIAPGFFDIADAGTTLTTTSFDSAVFNADLSSAPVNFLGTPRTAAVVSTNGFLTFESTASTTAYLAANPATATPNTLIAPFAGDLSSTTALGGKISLFRAGAGVDPFAAAPHWIVQWTHYYYYYCSAADLNFQIKMFDDGLVEVHYDRMASSDSLQCSVDSLASVSSWLENAAGDTALNISSRELTPVIRPYSAFRYSPR